MGDGARADSGRPVRHHGLAPGRSEPLPTDPNTLHISVTGASSSGSSATATRASRPPTTCTFPIGQPLIFDVTSTDVIHSFWVPDLYGKIDANPGRVNRITFKAKPAGRVPRRVRRAVRRRARRHAVPRRGGHPDRISAVAAAAAIGAPPAAPPAPRQARRRLAGAGCAHPASPSRPSTGAPAPAAHLPAAPRSPPVPKATLIAQKGCGGCHTIPGVAGRRRHHRSQSGWRRLAHPHRRRRRAQHRPGRFEEVDHESVGAQARYGHAQPGPE